MRSGCLERSNSACFLGGFILSLGIVCCGPLVWPASVLAQTVLPNAPYAVGATQVEFVDPSRGGRPLNFMLIYPAAPDADAPVFKVSLSTTPRRRVPLRHPLSASPRKLRATGYASTAFALGTSTLTCMLAAESRDGWIASKTRSQWEEAVNLKRLQGRSYG
jgi:hypothetical protein